MQRLSISKGHAFILVFSIASRQSLEELKSILELVNEVFPIFLIVIRSGENLFGICMKLMEKLTRHLLQVKGDLSGIPVMLVGNKSDEESGKREVAANTGSALEVRWQYPFIFSQ